MAFSSWYILGGLGQRDGNLVASGKIGRAQRSSQLLQVAVGNIVVAPVRNSVELEAVGELHLVLLLEPPALLGPLGVVLALPLPGGVEVPLGGCRVLWTPWTPRVLCELNLVGGAVKRRTLRTPSPLEAARRCLSGRCGRMLRTKKTGGSAGGGIPWGGGRGRYLDWPCLEGSGGFN